LVLLQEFVTMRGHLNVKRYPIMTPHCTVWSAGITNSRDTENIQNKSCIYK